MFNKAKGKGCTWVGAMARTNSLGEDELPTARGQG